MKKAEKRKKDAVRKRKSRKKRKILKMKNPNTSVDRKKGGRPGKRERLFEKKGLVRRKNLGMEGVPQKKRRNQAQIIKPLIAVNPYDQPAKRRNYAKENFDDRRVVAESFFD